MYSKHVGEAKYMCIVCGGKGHTRDRCCNVNGYPKWHPKYKKPGGRGGAAGSRWKNNSRGAPGAQRMANNVALGHNDKEDQNDSLLTPQHLEQIIKLMPAKLMKSMRGSETDDELDNYFSGMISCCMVDAVNTDWILDSGATDYMTSSLDALTNVRGASSKFTIHLPTGDVAKISHVGDVLLPNLKLSNVLYVPKFKHNLISVQKLTKESNCTVNFLPKSCVISYNVTNKVRVVGAC